MNRGPTKERGEVLGYLRLICWETLEIAVPTLHIAKFHRITFLQTQSIRKGKECFKAFEKAQNMLWL